MRLRSNLAFCKQMSNSNFRPSRAILRVMDDVPQSSCADLPHGPVPFLRATERWCPLFRDGDPAPSFSGHIRQDSSPSASKTAFRRRAGTVYVFKDEILPPCVLRWQQLSAGAAPRRFASWRPPLCATDPGVSVVASSTHSAPEARGPTPD
jgi:hypothetical protein